MLPFLFTLLRLAKAGLPSQLHGGLKTMSLSHPYARRKLLNDRTNKIKEVGSRESPNRPPMMFKCRASRINLTPSFEMQLG